jgi:hypothetical protein
MPVVIPTGVQVDLSGSDVSVKGPKGELKRTFSPLIGITREDGQIVITRKSDQPAERALHGTTRAVLANIPRRSAGRRVLKLKARISCRDERQEPGVVYGLFAPGGDDPSGGNFL